MRQLCKRWSCVAWGLPGAQWRHFELSVLATYKILFKIRKPENNRYLKKKNSKEIIMNHKGIRMVKDGEDWHGLQTTNWKIWAKSFNSFNNSCEEPTYLITTKAPLFTLHHSNNVPASVLSSSNLLNSNWSTSWKKQSWSKQSVR